MATYVISDIHGQYNMFIELLDKIDLKESLWKCQMQYAWSVTMNLWR